jgi:DNA-binding PadR family transcriptional regulator
MNYGKLYKVIGYPINMEEPCCTTDDVPECCDMKGFLSFLILWIVHNRKMRGCDISRELKKRRGTEPSPGTLYPVLRELKSRELLSSDRKKRYSLTEKGEKELLSALHYFSKIFFDVDEMFTCCSENSLNIQNV